MASKKRKLAEKDSETEANPEITFTHFFHECLNKALVKPWQEKELLTFFKQLGLREKETSDKYRDALARY